jgi:hypothetical protein
MLIRRTWHMFSLDCVGRAVLVCGTTLGGLSPDGQRQDMLKLRLLVFNHV